MAHKTFISFKFEDAYYKNKIQEVPGLEMIDKSLTEPINSSDEDYILRKIRSDYLSDSTVTIHLIGRNSAENQGPYEQRFIKRELQASLYSGAGNSKNGVLGIVLPEVHANVYRGDLNCRTCGSTHRYVNIGPQTVVDEFSINYYIPEEGKCSWSSDDQYCVLTSWESFCQDPSSWIEIAFQKRFAPIAEKTRARP